jgi:hypothetical protein
MESLTTIVFGIAVSIIPAYIAKNKGRNFVTWWIYGGFLLPIAFVHSLLLHGDKKCPYCSEYIKSEARVCKFCHRDIKETYVNS